MPRQLLALAVLLACLAAACAPRAASPEELARSAAQRSTPTPSRAGFVPAGDAGGAALRPRDVFAIFVSTDKLHAPRNAMDVAARLATEAG